MFKQSLLLVAFIASLLLFVKADQIIIYSPPRNAVYNAKDIMDLRYKGKSHSLLMVKYVILILWSVRFIGMTKYWSANTSLVHLESNTLVSNFTNLKWVAGKNESESSIHDVWNIPGDIKNGTYAFIVTAK